MGSLIKGEKFEGSGSIVPSWRGRPDLKKKEIYLDVFVEIAGGKRLHINLLLV